MKISLFKNAFAKDAPMKSLTFEQFIKGIKSGEWSKQVLPVRVKKDERAYKKAKTRLPAVTISGEFKSLNKHLSIEDKLIKHTGLICLDIDKKDNIKMRVQDLVDRECFAQFASCSGEGIKIIYKCTPTKSAAEHRRIYDAAVLRLQKKGVRLKIDPIVKNIASTQFVSYDPNAFYFPNSKLVIKPLPENKVKRVTPSADIQNDLEQLNSYIDSLGDRDITKNYEDWMMLAFGLSYSLGEAGREPFHRLSRNYPDYNENECNEKYDSCLERNVESIEKPVTIASVFQIVIKHLPKITLKQLAKKYNKGHAVGVGEDAEQGDLASMVRYKLFLFAKVIDKETNKIIDLLPKGINLNAFETLLKEKGFYRFGDSYVHIVDNIVEEVDINDILRIVTKHIETDGDYVFTYQKIEYHFNWEELAHLWRTIRAMGTTYNQVSSGLEHWEPNLLKDTHEISYVPYQNGVVTVTDKEIKLVPYASLKQQIWKERILPRNFTFTNKRGMFEQFFINVCGRGDTDKKRVASEYFKRAMWYYGYMLQGAKRQSNARAWLLYDIKTGNNGRSGKTIIGQAVGKIRSMVTIDGKQVDFKNNRFVFQTVTPWTDVVFIDDPSKFMSLAPLFNMITGELYADIKGSAPIVKSVKFMLASNWVLEAEGESEIGRQFVTQLDDFYVRYSKENGNTIQPIVHLHGKEFFTDWDDADWAQFDSFSMKCLQYHLKAESPSNVIIGNSTLIRFVQVYESELFFELASAFLTNVKRGKAGELLIPQQLLISIIKEHNANYGGIKAGKIAREFIAAIGAGKAELTSILVAGMARMAYKIKVPLDKLDFGEYTKNLPKASI